jgi:hypothetical protein
VLGRRHITSRILAVPASAHVATRLVFGYGASLVNALLDIDGVRESTLAPVAVELHRSLPRPKTVRNAISESAWKLRSELRSDGRVNGLAWPSCGTIVLAMEGRSRAVLGHGLGSAPSDNLDGDRFPGGAGKAGQWGEGISGAVPQFGEGVVRGASGRVCLRRS